MPTHPVHSIESTRCTECGRGLFFSERQFGPTRCRPCAAHAGLDRLCDRDFHRRMVDRSALMEPWWRWTIYLGHAVSWLSNDGGWPGLFSPQVRPSWWPG